ncbi:hypothetical protein OSSY52_00690 [Tepiditoga spiralis]|uniref:Peptide methionine sulfoxide reductase MsrA n=1 Tax=Tepiditoga spiralis TaxID=2108365 RepID=A0A7G1G1B0_9BACT|nr:peptide-methionine (S)-S-oxide reductase MsrA [Tepiditoga spiralis]BBE29928.1 hypothetical protein OSSY52_00690 [Tepiditoga spiralis]
MKNEKKYDKAILAAGCFWGVEDLLKNYEGIIDTRVGYTGGKTPNPTYEQVCYGFTGHAEAIELIYDKEKITYEQILKIFFDIHDFTQINRQGVDIGEQYRSSIFYINEEQKQIAENIISFLKKKGYDVATKLEKAKEFWQAEDYHQKYYEKTGKKSYCHYKRNIFKDE